MALQQNEALTFQHHYAIFCATHFGYEVVVQENRDGSGQKGVGTVVGDSGLEVGVRRLAGDGLVLESRLQLHDSHVDFVLRVVRRHRPSSGDFKRCADRRFRRL